MKFFFNSQLTVHLFFSLLVTIFIFSCESEIASPIEENNQEVISRSLNPCNPFITAGTDNCTDSGTFLGLQGDFVTLSSGCSAVVQVIIIKCVDPATLATDYSFL